MILRSLMRSYLLLWSVRTAPSVERGSHVRRLSRMASARQAEAAALDAELRAALVRARQAEAAAQKARAEAKIARELLQRERERRHTLEMKLNREGRATTSTLK